MAQSTGKSLFQQTLIEGLEQRLDVVDAQLATKLDRYVYDAKKNLLENNDLRHDSDIAHLEANTVDKTVYNAKMAILDAKDFEQDNRIATLQALLPSKVDQTVFDDTIEALTGTDVNHENRIVALENRANGFDTQISDVINVSIGQKIDEVVASSLLAGLGDSNSQLYQDLSLCVQQAAYDAAEASQTAVINQKADQTYVDDKVDALESGNLNWERRLNAVDQYIRLMLQTYKIKVAPGDPNYWEYVAAFDSNLEMEKYHFKVLARKPRGEFVVEMEPFAYNTFYGKLEMTLASGYVTSLTKAAFTNTAPHRAVISPNITRELSASDFGVTFKLYDSSLTAGGVIKSIPLSFVDYQGLTIMDAPRFSYSSSNFTLVQGYSGYTDATVQSIVPVLESGSVTPTGWSIVGSLPAGMTFSNGTFGGAPSDSAALGDYSVVVKAANGTDMNGFTIVFKVIARPTITYSVTTFSLLKNVEMNNITPTLGGTNHGALSVSAAGLLDGMFINSVTGVVYGAPTVVAANHSVTVTVAGKNGSSNTATLNFTVQENVPVIAYDNAGTLASPVIYRLNTLIDTLNINIGASSGSIDSLTIAPALPAGMEFVAQNAGGAWIGQIKGTPTASVVATEYTITAVGPGGTATTKVCFTVLPAIPTINYVANSYEFTKGVAITNVSPVDTGSPTTYALYDLTPNSNGVYVAATFNNGLVFNTSTGVISGTPTVAQASTGYTVIATGDGGKSAPDSFYITINNPVPVIAYANALNSFERNVTITPFGPSSVVNAPTLYTIDKALPAGLNFDNDTGVISGKPLVLSAAATYTVVAYNESGMGASVTFDLDVYETAPVIAYTQSSVTQVFTRGVAITPFAPSSKQSHIGSFAAPALATYGLSIDSNGMIFGVPSARSTGVVAVDVTATGNGGTSAPVTINVEVNEPAPVFSYGSATYVKLVDAALNINPISGVTNNVVSWEISQNLSDIGLSVVGGTITGTPNIVGGPLTGTVTAVGPDFSTTKNVVIDIDQEIPATNVQDGSLETGSGYELKLWSNPIGDVDEVFIKKTTAGDLTADLVYFTNVDGVMTKHSIAQKEFIGGDYIRFTVDRTTQYGSENRLVVVDEFGLEGEVVLAKFVVEPAALQQAPAPAPAPAGLNPSSGEILYVSGDKTQWSEFTTSPMTFIFSPNVSGVGRIEGSNDGGNTWSSINNGDVRIDTPTGSNFHNTSVVQGSDYKIVIVGNWNPYWTHVRVKDEYANVVLTSPLTL